MTAVIYARYSSDNQREESIEDCFWLSFFAAYPCNDLDWIGGRCKGRSNPFGTRKHSNHPANLCTWYGNDGKPFCWHFWTGSKAKEAVIRTNKKEGWAAEMFNGSTLLSYSMFNGGEWVANRHFSSLKNAKNQGFMRVKDRTASVWRSLSKHRSMSF